ncbi:DUF402 domain-containing protein [Rhodococcus rhodnii]|uniref:DUF402 domain-containing protein n=2 Tax=Rhodococcus rhodnii TaxID=38312 RepID=R7WTB5_9NOCA|nr:DUF402 domain-containing protein [Rhodococcus rhodnii]EOM78515.1 hypothetical protein Rrhod_0052 [Rhodococcus rhodnii LMG 5362]TXG91309.1 DUF402 domain-containing protein [Rhodococcus rhodnii]
MTRSTGTAGHSIHPPKHEVFDLEAMTNTDPKGFVRPVAEYRAEPWGLYMARSADHPSFDHVQSWLLPELGVRATIFRFTPGNERDQDRYVDIGRYRPGPQRWTSVDFYVDLVVRTGRETEVLDVDELFDATGSGLLDAESATYAVETAMRATDGIAAHGHDFDAWTRSLGMPIDWA